MRLPPLVGIVMLLSSITHAQTCNQTVAYYQPNSTSYLISDSADTSAQVFVATANAVDVEVNLQLATCKLNGLCGAELQIVSVTGSEEPNLNNVIGSDSVSESEIYGWSGCVPGTFGTTTFSFSDVNLVAGTKYGLALRISSGADPGSSIAWRRSATPIDSSNTYEEGKAWFYEFNLTWVWSYSNIDLQFEICDVSAQSTLGTENSSKDNLFTLSPNPAADEIQLKAASQWIGTDYNMYDQTGKLVLNGTINASNTSIDISHLSSGLYTFKVIGESNQTFRLAKQ